MGTLIKRNGYSVKGDAIIHHDTPLVWTDGDILAGRRLDRRKNYAVINGEVCEGISFVGKCSGCDGGCFECGYTGKRRVSCFVPLLEILPTPAERAPSTDGERT